MFSCGAPFLPECLHAHFCGSWRSSKMLAEGNCTTKQIPKKSVTHLLNLSFNIDGVLCSVLLRKRKAESHCCAVEMGCQDLLTFSYMLLVHSAWVHRVNLYDFGDRWGNAHWGFLCKTHWTCDAGRGASNCVFVLCRRQAELRKKLQRLWRWGFSPTDPKAEATLVPQFGSSLLPLSELLNLFVFAMRG